MKNEVILVSKISTLKKMGTTNFFRCLKENTKVTGIVLINKSEDSYLEFTLNPNTAQEGVSKLITATALLGSARVLKSQELRQATPNTTAHDLNIILKEFFETKKIDIRAETEKADYRSQSNPTVFTCRLMKGLTSHRLAQQPKVVPFTEENGNNYEALTKTIHEITKQQPNEPGTKLTIPTGVVQGF